MSKILTLWNTVKYLKLTQVYYRFYFFFKKKFFKKEYPKRLIPLNDSLNWVNKISNINSCFENNSFLFLNKTYQFKDAIDWNFSSYGKLWTYNLNYFDFINQKEITKEKSLELIEDYIVFNDNLIDGKEPYPISLRSINWIKFLSNYKIINKSINQNLYNHYQLLLNNTEYHLLGNHLLENGFAFIFGAYYFKDEVLYKKGVKILKSELNEQILNDGGHFELSPMYHQLILYRVLDCIHLIKLNTWKNDDFLIFLQSIAIKMLSWLKEVTFKNGDIPMVNDSSFDIAPNTDKLFRYAKELNLNPQKIKLSDSGYRMFIQEKFELFVDVGNVGPSYQPGHAHSDTFNFILYVNKEPFLVDTGVSTYEKNEIRQSERGTSSHNTVQIGDIEQTQVWGGFRVAKRAKITSLNEGERFVQAEHDGYKNLRIIHSRKFIVEETKIIIEDIVSNSFSHLKSAYFHLHPRITQVQIENSKVIVGENKSKIFFKGENIFITRESYKFAAGFNKTINAIKLKVYFESNLETTIEL